MALRPSTIEIIKATAPVLAEHGYAITTTMYKHMLPNNKQVSELFNPTHQVVLPGDKVARQPQALAQSVLAYAENIDNLGALASAVERIAQKHVSVHVLPEHYPIVGQNLLKAIKEVLGDAATPEIMEAWEEGYGFLAKIFIDRERTLREGKGVEPGGWEGWRDFVVTKKVVESSEITSFYLEPQDKKPIIGFLPGQYIGIRIETPMITTQRNYSLSMAPTDSQYRITVKKAQPAAPGCPMGAVSSYLHDQVQLGSVLKITVPCGDFVLDTTHNKPIVLLSGGVGITPIASMVEHMIQTKIPNKIVLVDYYRNPSVAALTNRFEELARDHANLTVKTLYSEDPSDVTKHIHLSSSILESCLETRDAHYYLCGPPPFMNTSLSILRQWEIPEDQIHYEFFGPHDSNKY